MFQFSAGTSYARYMHIECKGGIVFIHVKGHSDNDGNDKADERVQWGKEDGPYCRFTTNGEPEGDYIDQPRPADAPPPSSPLPHPSPTSRLRNSVPPLRPFSSNLSTIRPRTSNEPTPRQNTLGLNGNFFASSYIESAINNISCCKQLNFSPPSLQDTVPGLLDTIGCRDVMDSILNRCGVMCLARLALVCTSTRDIISEYNSRTKRIFPVRCGGFDHEHHMFWTTYKRERAAELSSLPSQADDTSYRPSSPSTINDEDTNNNWTSSLSPSSNDTNTYTSSPNSTTGDDTNL